MWQAYFSRWKIAWQSSCLYIFTLDSPCRPPLLSPPHPPLPSQPLLSPWERAPLEPFTPGSVPTAIWLWNIIWNSHAFEGDTAGAISQRSGGVLSARGGGGGGGEGGGGDFWLGYRLALRGSAWQIIDLSGRRWQQRHVCECSDCY